MSSWLCLLTVSYSTLSHSALHMLWLTRGIFIEVIYNKKAEVNLKPRQWCKDFGINVKIESVKWHLLIGLDWFGLVAAFVCQCWWCYVFPVFTAAVVYNVMSVGGVIEMSQIYLWLARIVTQGIYTVTHRTMRYPVPTFVVWSTIAGSSYLDRLVCEHLFSVCFTCRVVIHEAL